SSAGLMSSALLVGVALAAVWSRAGAPLDARGAEAWRAPSVEVRPRTWRQLPRPAPADRAPILPVDESSTPHVPGSPECASADRELAPTLPARVTAPEEDEAARLDLER